MADQVNPGPAEEHELHESGLLLSSEPIEGGSPLHAAADTDTTDADGRDLTDKAGDTDSSDSDTADVDGGDDGPAADGDLSDAGADADEGDESADALDIVGDNLDGSLAKDADSTDAK
jgi:hypothetical protein